MKRTLVLWKKGGRRLRWTSRDRNKGRGQAGRGGERRRNDAKTRHGMVMRADN